MVWIEPKTDWNSNDSYNFVDLNRVENNTAEVAAFLESIQYQIPSMVIVTNRGKTSIDFIGSMNRVESNIEALRASFITPPGYQDKKTWSVGMGFDYRDAHRFENNLKLLYNWAHLAKDNLRYCGTFACGGDVI